MANDVVPWGEAHAALAPTVIVELVNSTLLQRVLGMDAGDIDVIWNKICQMQLASHDASTAAVRHAAWIMQVVSHLATEIILRPDECQVFWLEELFPPHDYKSYIAAKALGDTPLAAGENHYATFDFECVIDDGASTVLQSDLSKTRVLPRRCVSSSLRR